jgi:hypothetical protein
LGFVDNARPPVILMILQNVRRASPGRHAWGALLPLAIRLALPAEATAQTTLPTPRITVTAEAGAAASTRWFRPASTSGGLSSTVFTVGTVGRDGTPDAGPTFGAGAEFWLGEAAALRLHAAYAKQRLSASLPFGVVGGKAHVGGEARVRADMLIYDVSAVVRPFSPFAPAALRGLQLSAGAGASTTWFSGNLPLPTVGFVPVPPGCRAELVTSGICVPRSATTRPQATLGLGVDAIPLTRNLRLFAGLEVHLQRPPVLTVESAWASGNLLVPQGTSAAVREPRTQAAAAAQGASVSGLAATGRLVLGLRAGRRTRGHRPDSLSVPPPPPPLIAPGGDLPAGSPTTGGYVEVRTAVPGAAVYLVPFNRWRRAAMLCRLRPVHGTNSYYQGSTASAVPVAALIRRPVTHFLVVVQGGRFYEERIQVVNNAVERRQLNMAVDGAPTGCR